MFHCFNEKGLVPGIEELVKQDTTPTSNSEDPLPVNLIPDEG